MSWVLSLVYGYAGKYLPEGKPFNKGTVNHRTLNGGNHEENADDCDEAFSEGFW